MYDSCVRPQRPVLAVRQETGAPQTAYGRLLVAVDLSDASRNLVATASVLCKHAQIELFHAINTSNERKLRSADVSEKSIKAYLQECRRHAQNRLLSMTDSSDARRNRVGSAIGHGDPARQTIVQQQHGGTDLIVVGKDSTNALSDFFFGSVSQRVLQGATTDVLVIPRGFAFGTRLLAARRLAQVPLVTRRIRAGSQKQLSGGVPDWPSRSSASWPQT